MNGEDIMTMPRIGDQAPDFEAMKCRNVKAVIWKW